MTYLSANSILMNKSTPEETAADANARLMAAATELLEALREIVRAWDLTTFPVSDRMEAALNDADAAIAKAEGRDQ